jgi:hypothetical protein
VGTADDDSRPYPRSPCRRRISSGWFRLGLFRGQGVFSGEGTACQNVSRLLLAVATRNAPQGRVGLPWRPGLTGRRGDVSPIPSASGNDSLGDRLWFSRALSSSRGSA